MNTKLNVVQKVANVILVVTTVVSIVSIYACIQYSVQQTRFRKIDPLWETNLKSIITNFINLNGRFPETMDEITRFTRDTGISEDIWVDPFEPTSYLSYFILKNPKTGDNTGYLVLSVGIDGKKDLREVRKNLAEEMEKTYFLEQAENRFGLFERKDLLVLMYLDD